MYSVTHWWSLIWAFVTFCLLHSTSLNDKEKTRAGGFYSGRRTGCGLNSIGLDHSGARGRITGTDSCQWIRNWFWIVSNGTRGSKRDTVASSDALLYGGVELFQTWIFEHLQPAHFALTEKVLFCAFVFFRSNFLLVPVGEREKVDSVVWFRSLHL